MPAAVARQHKDRGGGLALLCLLVAASAAPVFPSSSQSRHDAAIERAQGSASTVSAGRGGAAACPLFPDDRRR